MTNTSKYRAMYLDPNTGDWYPTTAPTTQAAAQREVERLVAAGYNAMVESVQSSRRLAARGL